jgi:hypothetical protein
VRDDDPLGKLYGLDVNITDRPAHELPRGTAVRLRVIEGESHRVLGETDLAEDGSFHVQVPADLPLQLQTLDRDGLAVHTSAVIWARRHESRGCIGCHEDPERTPPNRLAHALTQPAVVMAPPEGERRIVDFRRDVRPILEQRCASCHSEGGESPLLVTAAAGEGALREVYDRLLVKHVEPGRARASRLTWHLLGRVTSRPWDEAPGPVRPMPEPRTVTEEEIRTLASWIDLGALWDAGEKK